MIIDGFGINHEDHEGHEGMNWNQMLVFFNLLMLFVRIAENLSFGK